MLLILAGENVELVTCISNPLSQTSNCYCTSRNMNWVKWPKTHETFLRCIKTHLSYNVDSTHDQLVQVTVYHEASAVDQRVLKTGPDLRPQLIRNVQRGTQLPQTHGHQSVNLRRAGENMTTLNIAAPFIPNNFPWEMITFPMWNTYRGMIHIISARTS